MARKKDGSQTALFVQAHAKTAPCVPGIIAAVDAWRLGGYEGITDTTRILLNHWFHRDHRLANGERFEFHDSQRKAIETLIYLFEVAKVQRQKALLEKFVTDASIAETLRLLQYDDFARYCVKMATGSGKTMVMALAILWQYFNAVAEGKDDYAKTTLLIAPNVIVFERLRHDYAGGWVFRTFNMIPEQLKVFWDFDIYLRGDGERAWSQGALYLTNIQQLYIREESEPDEPEPIAAELGPKPPASKAAVEDFADRIVKRSGPVLVVNDEAHHTHDEGLSWNATIRDLNDKVSGGLSAQLDFTATPRHSKGNLFTWTVYDYPLKQAILDGIVKRPIKGITTGIKEKPSEIASVKYQAFLTAGVERWREYRDQLAPVKKKPILFIMMNETGDADDVGDWLRTKFTDEFGGDKLLIIHTDKKGEVSKKDLDDARKLAREVDDEKSPINCIVSVLMLREGWDVQNVTVVVGLRPYTSKAAILPEQAIGRGLRLMFRGMQSDYRERVDVIGNAKFIEFVEQLEKEEGLELETFAVGKDKLVIETIQPDSAKSDKDIGLPVLTPILVRKKSLEDEINSLDVMTFDSPVLRKKDGEVSATKFQYEGYDMLTNVKELSREYTIPEPQTAEEVIGYYAKRIAQDVKLPSQFAALVPKVREFLENKAFGEKVDLSKQDIIRAISTNTAHYLTKTAFARALRERVVDTKEPELLTKARMLSETPAFPFSKPAFASEKTIFNLVAADNDFERTFAKFLHRCRDVVRFAKLPKQFSFSIEYTDGVGNLRYYEPDFVAVTSDGTHYLVETKGAETPEVQFKDRAAKLWCENATKLTDTDWDYIKVPQKGYEDLQPDLFEDLGVFAH